MECAIERAIDDVVAGIVGCAHAAENFGHARDQDGMIAFDGGSRGGDLEDFAQLADLHDLVAGQTKYVSTALRQHVDQSLELELQQGLAHRRLRDAELGGERIFRQGFAEPQAAVDDARAQIFDHQLGQ